MTDFVLVVFPLFFLMLAVLFFHKYFNKNVGKRDWLYLWYGLVFLLLTVFMYFYVMLKELFL